MSNVNRDADLIRLRNIILSTIEYHIARIEDDLIGEHRDIVVEYYSQQKHLVEKYFLKRRLDRLEQKLRIFIKMPQSRGDRGFNDFIKAKTNYDIDIFKEIRERTDLIIKVGKISDNRELDDVATFLNAYERQPEYHLKVESLKTLLLEYIERNPRKVVKSHRRASQ